MRWSRSRSGRGAAWTPCGALFALAAELLLALQIFVEAHCQILDDHVLNAEAPLELGNQLFVIGADLLINVNAFAMLGHTISEFARAPKLGLLDLRAFFGASGLDAGDHFLDFVFRRCRAGDENQIVQSLLHDDLFPLCAEGIGGTSQSVPGANPEKPFTLFPALPLPAAFAV